MKISSINNDKVIFWAKLKMKKYRDIEHLFIVEGDHLVEEALKKGIVKEIISLDSQNYDVPCYEVTPEIMKRLTCLISAPKIMAVCKYIMPDDIKGNVLLLDGLQDPGNVGTIIRSAVAFGFDTIISSLDSVDFYNDKVIRSSEGMIFNINILRSDLTKIIPLLKEKKYYIVGTDPKKGLPISNFRSYKCAYIIGNEGNGISVEIREKCDNFVYIKTEENCESLNAAVAASIIMYGVYHE